MGVTIKDIATAAGVSYSTVSKALNNSQLVTEKTKQRIVAIAREMGYEPNFAAQRLVSKQSKTIGLIWPTLERLAPSALVTQINHEVEKNGYSMIISINSIEQALPMLRRFQVDGIIVFNEQTSDTQVALPDGLPIVSFGLKHDQHTAVIDVNYKAAMQLAVEYLSGLGHEHMAFIGDFSPVDDRQMAKYEGFTEAMKKAGLPVKRDYLLNTAGLDWFDGYMATKRLLSGPALPTAIIGASYDISAGIVRAIRETGLVIPKDISVIGYDNIPQMATLEVPLTSIGVPVEAIAEQITALLFDQIGQTDSDHETRTLQPVLIERLSCARANFS